MAEVHAVTRETIPLKEIDLADMSVSELKYEHRKLDMEIWKWTKTLHHMSSSPFIRKMKKKKLYIKDLIIVKEK